jgi:hypothetical protein
VQKKFRRTTGAWQVGEKWELIKERGEEWTLRHCLDTIEFTSIHVYVAVDWNVI